MLEQGQPGSTSAIAITDLIEQHAWDTGNRKKLGKASDRSERHLFIWVESSQQSAAAAVDFMTARGSMPPPPNLPDFVDAVWIARALIPSHVWQYSRSTGWRDLGQFTISA